jgi:hypothetical protein
MTKTLVTYTYDRPQEALDAERELNRLDLLPADERPADYAPLRAGLIAALPPVERIRITVRAIALMDRAHYQALLRAGATWFQERYGRELMEDFEDSDFELIQARAACLRYAEVFCAIPRRAGNGRGFTYLAETQSHPYGDKGAAWQPATLPAAWCTMDGFSSEMPLALADALIEASMNLNGGVLPTIPFFATRQRISISVSA